MARQAEEMAKLTLAQEEEERSFLAEAQLTMAPGEFLQVTLLPTHPHIHGHSQPRGRDNHEREAPWQNQGGDWTRTCPCLDKDRDKEACWTRNKRTPSLRSSG